jgi:hypothetical protein
MAEKISKQEAVRRALAHFGNDAKPTQMQGWIKSEFGIDMGTDHISTAKGDILRKAGVKAKPAKKAAKAAPKAQAAKAAPKAQAAKAAPKVQKAGPPPKPQPAGGIPLDAIISVKALLGRIGRDQLHKLIDALAT